jgi:DNA-binding IclR family transcriptional regulator
MALLGAICVNLTAVGFTHRSLRARVNHLLGIGYSASQMSYDLATLRRNGLIERRPHSNTYILTTEGLRVALFYTKVHNRLLRPLLAADKALAPARLRHALATIDRHVNGYIDDARMKNAA